MIHLIVSFLPLAVCAFWSVAIAINLWEQGNRAAHRELLLWAVTATLLYTGHFVFFNRMTGRIPVSDTIYVVCNLSVYPLYLYYLTMLTKGTVSRRQRLLTWLPPIIIGVAVAVIYAMMSGDECRQFVDTYIYRNSKQGLSGATYAQAVVHHIAKGVFAMGVLAVLITGIRQIRQYNRLIDSIYADNDDKRLYGITTILILMVVTGVLSLVVNAIGRYVFLSFEIPFAVLACFFSGLLYLLCYRGFVQQFSFADIAQEEREETMESSPIDSHSQWLQKIDEEELYLKPGLTLAELAQLLGTNRTMLSKVVNDKTGMPFAEFINRKRIAYVKRLEKEHTELRKDELAAKAGYTSMRSFYRNYNLYSDSM